MVIFFPSCLVEFGAQPTDFPLMGPGGGPFLFVDWRTKRLRVRCETGPPDRIVDNPKLNCSQILILNPDLWQTVVTLQAEQVAGGTVGIRQYGEATDLYVSKK